jgi:hypothetical protein
MRAALFALAGLACLAPLQAQMPKPAQPSVEMAPVPNVALRAGGTAKVELDFRIGNAFHINSNQPKSPLLIPTSLKLNPPEPVQLVGVRYPPGEEQSFPFAPNEKLSVYSGDFALDASLKAPAKAAPGTYTISGELRYQACDRNACYPPKNLPVQFKVMVK